MVTTDSPYLITEDLRAIQPTLAVNFGINQAHVLQQIQYWLNKNKKKGVNYHDERYWAYNTSEQWAEQLPWMSASYIRKILTELRHKGIILTGQYHKDKFNKTLWYSIDYECLNTYLTDAPASSEVSNSVTSSDTIVANRSSLKVADHNNSNKDYLQRGGEVQNLYKSDTSAMQENQKPPKKEKTKNQTPIQFFTALCGAFFVKQYASKIPAWYDANSEDRLAELWRQAEYIRDDKKREWNMCDFLDGVLELDPTPRDMSIRIQARIKARLAEQDEMIARRVAERAAGLRA